MTRNVDIMQMTSQIGPFDNAKEQAKVHLGQSLKLFIQNYCKPVGGIL
jgi:hypothetical protein